MPGLLHDRPGRGAGPRQWVRRSLLSAGFVVVMAFAQASSAEAQPRSELPNAEVAEEAIARLRSPYCPGLMLEVCPSPQAGALRDSIYVMAAQGASSDELVEWMIGNHGEEWRGVPQGRGAGLWAWVIPPLALLIGLSVLVGWLRYNRSTAAALAPAEPPEISEADRAELAEAMREWKQSGEESI